MSPSGAPPYPPSGRGNSQTGHPQSKGAGSAMAQSRFASTPAGLSPGVKVSQDYRNSGSLLGQSYQAPSTEKFAKKPAVKVVRSDMAKPIIDEHAILKPQIENAVVEKPVVQSPVGQNPVVQKSVIQQPMTQKPVIKKPVTQMPVIEMPDIPKPVIQRTVIEMPNVQKSVVEKPARLDVQKPKLDAPLNVAKSSPLDYAVKPTAQDYAVKPVEKPEGKENTASSLQKLDKHHGTPQPRSEQKAAIAITHEDVERFTDPTGRRICLASIPPGTRQSDVCDMIVGMANAKISIENVAVFNFPGEPRPNYALVETESEKEAGRIASWVDRERLFGWPISARVVRSMTKEQVNTVLRGENLDIAVPKASVPEVNSPSLTTTTPQPLRSHQCRYWAQGHCRHGANCFYSHSGEPGMLSTVNYSQGSGLRPATSRQSLRSIHSVTSEHFVDDGKDLVGTRNYRGWPKQDR